jgi:hypothetical protein
MVLAVAVHATTNALKTKRFLMMFLLLGRPTRVIPVCCEIA